MFMTNLYICFHQSLKDASLLTIELVNCQGVQQNIIRHHFIDIFSPVIFGYLILSQVAGSYRACFLILQAVSEVDSFSRHGLAAKTVIGQPVPQSLYHPTPSHPMDRKDSRSKITWLVNVPDPLLEGHAGHRRCPVQGTYLLLRILAILVDSQAFPLYSCVFLYSPPLSLSQPTSHFPIHTQHQASHQNSSISPFQGDASIHTEPSLFPSLCGSVEYSMFIL